MKFEFDADDWEKLWECLCSVLVTIVALGVIALLAYGCKTTWEPDRLKAQQQQH